MQFLDNPVHSPIACWVQDGFLARFEPAFIACEALIRWTKDRKYVERTESERAERTESAQKGQKMCRNNSTR